MSKKQMIGGVLGIVACLAIAMMAPPADLVVAEGMDPQKSMIGMGLLICTLIWMAMRVMPEYIILLLFCSACAATGSLTFTQAFSPFSGTSYWLLVGALVLGAAVAHAVGHEGISGNLSRTAFGNYDFRCGDFSADS